MRSHHIIKASSKHITISCALRCPPFDYGGHYDVSFKERMLFACPVDAIMNVCTQSLDKSSTQSSGAADNWGSAPTVERTDHSSWKVCAWKCDMLCTGVFEFRKLLQRVPGGERAWQEARPQERWGGILEDPTDIEETLEIAALGGSVWSVSKSPAGCPHDASCVLPASDSK
jgi:hypothetical protein